MKMNPIIQAEDVWKKYKIPHERRTTLFEHVGGILEVLGGRQVTYEEFWALKEIDFSVEPGESIGIIGDNGSGKSTLLKIIAMILRPTRGRVRVYGKVAPILELGVGFHPDLTVEENILVYGSIMGLKNSEVKKRMEPILKFSGVERFRDAKLKNLSSGMQMRLGFSVAIETNPDVFLIDEALTVGDIDFQQKCIDKFKQFKAEKKTIILVSHALGLVEDFCEKTVLLSKGEMAGFGPTAYVVDQYQGLARGS